MKLTKTQINTRLKQQENLRRLMKTKLSLKINIFKKQMKRKEHKDYYSDLNICVAILLSVKTVDHETLFFFFGRNTFVLVYLHCYI